MEEAEACRLVKRWSTSAGLSEEELKTMWGEGAAEDGKRDLQGFKVGFYVLLFVSCGNELAGCLRLEDEVYKLVACRGRTRLQGIHRSRILGNYRLCMCSTSICSWEKAFCVVRNTCSHPQN